MRNFKTFLFNHSTEIVVFSGCMLSACMGAGLWAAISNKRNKDIYRLADYGRLSLLLCEQAVRSGKEEVEKIDWRGNGKTMVSLKAIVE